MAKTKSIVLLIAASVLIATLAGIAFAQYVGAQTSRDNENTTQIPQITSGSNYPYAQQGNYPYGSTQYAYPYEYRMGMGMCGRYW
jgi:hypothetical protein